MSELGGVARHVLDVVERGIPGWNITVLAPAGPLAQRCTELGAEVIVDAFGPARGVVASMRSLRRAVRACQPAIVHSHLAFADIAAVVAATGIGVRLVSTEHGIAPDDRVHHRSRRSATAMAAVHRVRLLRSDAVIAVSRSTLDEVRAKWHPPGRLSITVIANGVDRVPVDARAHGAGPGLRVGALERLAPEKGALRLLDAFAVVVRDHPTATLRLGGVGPTEAAVRSRIVALGLDRSVELCGFVDPQAFLAETDVLVQLSAWENCSYSLLDGLVAAVGIVASRVGGNLELLPPPCLAAPDDPVEAAARIVEQGMDPDARPHLPVGWPSVTDMCDRIAAVYADVTGAPPARHRAHAVR